MKVILFTQDQLDKLADICIGLGHLIFGSLVLPFFISSLDKPTIAVLVLGLIIAISLWLTAVRIVENK